ncbi:MAG: hypothetical protein AAF637_22415, partial [Pseudomonadota bacterium]
VVHRPGVEEHLTRSARRAKTRRKVEAIRNASPRPEAGFEFGEIERGYLVDGPRAATYHYVGSALA